MKRVISILLIVLWFAAPAFGEGEFLESVNAFRTRPLDFVHLTGKSPEELRSLWSEELFRVLLNGAPPLVEVETLDEVARLRAEEILRLGLPLPEDFEEGLEKLLEDRGADLLLYREFYILIAFENPLPEDRLRNILLEELFRGALERRNDVADLLFPCWDVIGAAFTVGDIFIEGEPFHAGVLVLITGALEKDTPRLLGKVYGVSEGEEIPLDGVRMVFTKALQPHIRIVTRSWSDGSFCLTGYPEGIYSVILEHGDFPEKMEWSFLPARTYRRNYYLFAK